MNVEQLMTRDVCTTHPDATLSEPARMMFERDCGSTPVVDEEGRLISMITDRDISIAAYTQGKRLEEIPVWSAMSQSAFAVRADEPLEAAEQLMSDHQVRRIPVVDEAYRVVGIISIGDLARRAHPSEEGGQGEISPFELTSTLAAVSEPRLQASA